jgi:hypothetical protein
VVSVECIDVMPCMQLEQCELSRDCLVKQSCGSISLRCIEAAACRASAADDGVGGGEHENQLSCVRTSVNPPLASAGGPGTSTDMYCTSCTEAVLCTHQLVSGCVIIGTPHAGYNQVSGVEVVLRTSGALSDSQCLSDNSAGSTADMRVPGYCKYSFMH